MNEILDRQSAAKDLERARESISAETSGAADRAHEKNLSAWERLKRSILPDPKAARWSDYQSQYGQTGRTFTDLLPYYDVADGGQQIGLSDGLTRMATYEITPVPTEGRVQDDLVEAMESIRQIVQETCAEHRKDPWVIQIYGQPEPDVSGYMEQVRACIDDRARESLATGHYLEDLEEHLVDVADPAGYFYDKEVADAPWRGQFYSVRVVLMRRYYQTQPTEEPGDELEQTCGRFEDALGELGVDYRRLDAEGFYYWLQKWLNPRPEVCGGDPRGLREVAPYPGDTSPKVFGSDFAESIVLSAPVPDRKKGIWHLDGMAHTTLMSYAITGQPKIGQLTGEIQRSGKSASLADKLPPGTVIAMTIIVESQEKVMRAIESRRNRAWGPADTAVTVRKEANEALRRMNEDGVKLYPVEMAFYLRAEDRKSLRRIVNRAQVQLMGRGIRTMNPWKDRIQGDHFVKMLPGIYIAGMDQKARNRARLHYDETIACMAPLFGRTRGTPNIGINLFNRGGEPIGFDPLSADRTHNGNMFVVGPPGSGKSSFLSLAMICQMAINRPRIFIIEKGDSFRLVCDYFESVGVSVYRARADMASDTSLPPFADLARLHRKAGEDAQREALELPDEEARFAEDLAEFGGDGEDDLSDGELETLQREEEIERRNKREKRDYLGEAEGKIRLMRRDPEDGVTVKLSATVRQAVRRGIVLAAERCNAGETEHEIVITTDIADAIGAVAMYDEYAGQREEILDVSNSVRNFCDEGLDGKLFNSPGSLWPEAEVTHFDLAEAAADGRQNTKAIGYISLIEHITRIVERDQDLGRPTIVLTDECHMITTDPMLAPYLIAIVKMWRKLMAWAWFATQNLDDFPDNTRRMLNMIEWWVCLGLTANEIDQVVDFKNLRAGDRAMLENCRKGEGQYTEGVVFAPRMKALFRSVPYTRIFALAGTEGHEKTRLRRVRRRDKLGSDLAAANVVAREIRRARLDEMAARAQESGGRRAA